MTTMLSNSSATYELYHDQKLATWALYEPRVGSMPMPFWQAMGDGYGRKVTILAPTRADAIKKVEEFSGQNPRKVSKTEADAVFTYSTYGLITGGLIATVGYLGSMPKVSRFGGVLAGGSLIGVVTGKILEPKVADKDDAIVLDLGKP